ncbi:MAG: polysaccharide biosynthesis C-terminal domain-containing protein [Pseudomonadota bacterium]
MRNRDAHNQGIRMHGLNSAKLYALEHAGVGGFSFLVFFTATHLANIEAVGTLAALWALVSVQSAVCSLGLDRLTYAQAGREAAKRSSEASSPTETLSHAIRASLLPRVGLAASVGLGIYVTTLIALAILSGAHATNLYALLGMRLALGVIEPLRTYHQAVDAPARYALARIVSLGVASLALLITRGASGSLTGVAFIAGLEALAFALWMTGKSRAFGVRGDEWQDLSGLLKTSLPFLVQSLAIMIYLRIDMLYVAQQFGPSDTALYASAARIAEIGNGLALVAMLTVTPPLIHQLRKSGQHVGWSGLLIGMLGCAAFAAVCWIAGPHLLSLLFGRGYEAASLILAIYALSVPFVFLGGVSSRLHASFDNQKLPARITVLGACLNVTLTAILCAYVGPIGAALATVISYAFVAFSLWFAFLRGLATTLDDQVSEQSPM